MRIRDAIFKEGSKTRKFLRKINNIIRCINFTNIKKFFILIKKQGLVQTLKNIKKGIDEGRVSNGKILTSYEMWIQANEPTEEELEKQRKTKFKYEPKISLLVPLYKTPKQFFEELVTCLKEQTYSNWELCLSDGSPKDNEDLKDIIKSDKRIKYKKLEKNEGIAGNTNACIKMATGDFIALFDHDDLLPKFSLYEVVKAINENPDVEFLYSDEDKITTIDKPRFEPHFKPDFSPDFLRANNYICHLSVFKKELMDKLEGERSKYDGAQDFDIILRMSEKTKNIVHIPKVLYHWRVHENSTAKAGGEAKPYAFEAGIPAIEDHLKRIGLKGKVEHGATLGTYHVRYDVIGNPKVSIIIPNKDGIDYLKVCINSILSLTTYKNYEIVIVENNSEKEETFKYYKEIEKNNKIKILYYPDKGFNYAKIINFGVKNVDGEYIIQLNNDTELLTPEWLEEMIGFAQREDVGAVGVKMYYEDNTIQHAGLAVGVNTVAAHLFKGIPRNQHGYFARESTTQNLSAVTAACIMAKKEIYEQVGYMDEKFAVAFNDVDFCLKIRELNKLIVYDPFVEFMHYESKTRGEENTPEKIKRFEGEIKRFLKKWDKFLKEGDPYFNINFDLESDKCEPNKGKVTK